MQGTLRVARAGTWYRCVNIVGVSVSLHMDLSSRSHEMLTGDGTVV